MKFPDLTALAQSINFKRLQRLVIRIGISVGVLVAVAFITIKATHASYLLSPGKLSDVEFTGEVLGGVSSHADLERECSHCHAPIHCVEDTRCQDCHFDIAEDRTNINTLHGRLPGVSKCQNCHPEHNGADADLTLLPYLNVDHYLLAGFSLEKHTINYDGTNLNCETCHQQNVTVIETIDCVDCHATQDHDSMAKHIEDYGSACSECHDGRDRMINGFVHEPYFPLQAGHQDLQCSQCHHKEQYIDLASDCAACHQEPEMHADLFGTTCENCHTATAWSPAQLSQHAFGLTHGGEPISDCESCHTETFTSCDCSLCHEESELNMAQMNQQAQQNGLLVQQSGNSTPGDHEGYEMENCLACHAEGIVNPGVQNRSQGGNGTGQPQNQGNPTQNESVVPADPKPGNH